MVLYIGGNTFNYGPYLYIHKTNTGYILYSKNNKVVNNLLFFEDTININLLIKYCKDWYMDLNKKFIREIEDLESKRDEIMNYVF